MPSVIDRVLSAIIPDLGRLRSDVTDLQNKVNQMATKEEVAAVVARFDAATDEIANDLKALREQLAAAGVSDDVLAQFDSRVARLESMGKDPENPV